MSIENGEPNRDEETESLLSGESSDVLGVQEVKSEQSIEQKERELEEKKRRFDEAFAEFSAKYGNGVKNFGHNHLAWIKSRSGNKETDRGRMILAVCEKFSDVAREIEILGSELKAEKSQEEKKGGEEHYSEEGKKYEDMLNSI